jgi:TP901-1 family phage major tail protein
MKGVVNYKEGGQADAGDWAALSTVRDLTLNLEAGEADVTTRGNNGWRATLATLKDASVDLESIWDPADAGLVALRDAYLNNELIGIQVLDEEDGEGLQADMMVTSFSRSEPLEEGMTVAISMKPTYSETAPTWVVPTPP